MPALAHLVAGAEAARPRALGSSARVRARAFQASRVILLEAEPRVYTQETLCASALDLMELNGERHAPVVGGLPETARALPGGLLSLFARRATSPVWPPTMTSRQRQIWVGRVRLPQRAARRVLPLRLFTR